MANDIAIALAAAFDAETNALAARIDSFEVAVGGTITQLVIDELKSISVRLKSLGAPIGSVDTFIQPPPPAPVEPEALPTEPDPVVSVVESDPFPIPASAKRKSMAPKS